MMLANNSVMIIMIVMSYITLSAPVAYFFILAPRQLEARKKRQIAKLHAGADVLADAINRGGQSPELRARLQAQYEAHTRAVSALSGGKAA